MCPPYYKFLCQRYGSFDRRIVGPFNETLGEALTAITTTVYQRYRRWGMTLKGEKSALAASDHSMLGTIFTRQVPHCQPEISEDFFHGDAFASPVLKPGFRASYRLALFFGNRFVVKGGVSDGTRHGIKHGLEHTLLPVSRNGREA
jgi:hypothetical protein